MIPLYISEMEKNHNLFVFVSDLHGFTCANVYIKVAQQRNLYTNTCVQSTYTVRQRMAGSSHYPVPTEKIGFCYIKYSSEKKNQLLRF